MKRNEISKIINTSFHQLDGLLSGVIIDLEIDSIHQFRTEIKKLRAFLRLLNTQPGRQLKISKKIKRFYNYIGTIRNLQLQLINVNEWVILNAANTPNAYLAKLNSEIELFQRGIIILISHQNLYYNKDKILARLPDNFKKTFIKQFIHKNLRELRQLIINKNDDEALHSIRKILKDILYNWPCIKKYRKLLPSGISKKRNIQSLTDILGDFCDRKTWIELLRNHFPPIVDDEEKLVLKKLLMMLHEEKLLLKQQIYYCLQLIQSS